ncbi:MAG: hypothetical protein FWF97_04770 [Alphaproteobacteria bacterium]|nr:hypothetical protein [Alphaproteobacteria bacterium]
MKTSLISLLCVFCALSAEAALRIGNSGTGRGGSYTATQTGAYAEPQQQQQASQQEMIMSARTSEELGLPVRVANMDLARRIASRDPSAEVTMAQLDACSLIYPGGAFAWDTANAGLKNSMGCVADVEMRLMQGTEDIVLARARVAAGGAIDCNIDAFPSEGYTMEAGKIEFPADAEPTEEDVKKVMDAEQKQGAGMRIAAATLIGGLGGNFVGANDPGKSGMLGTSGDKMKKTLLGAAAMGGLTAASTQSGKVGGDVIMGATVNAAGGMLIGNISGIGNNMFLVTKKCEGGQECLFGTIGTSKPICNGGAAASEADKTVCSQEADGKSIRKQDAFWGSSGSTTKVRCNFSEKDGEEVFNGCDRVQISDWNIAKGGLNQGSKHDDVLRTLANETKYCLVASVMEKAGSSNCDGGEVFYKMTDAWIMGNQEAAVIVGWDAKKTKGADWTAFRNSEHPGGVIIKYRYPDGTIGQEVPKELGLKNFNPVMQGATDGAIIDLNNKARAGATATGAGIGGALGGFSAYQGAKDDIQNRYVAEVMAYKDSLTKIYCATGKRFLGQYNESIMIPLMK